MEKKKDLLKINPSLEAFRFGEALAVFAGDRSLVFRGQDNTDFFSRLRAFFTHPRSEAEIKELDGNIYGRLETLIETGILIRDTEGFSVEFYGSGRIAHALQKLWESSNKSIRQKTPLLICIPDSTGLSEQKKALKLLKPGHSLLTGIYRGASFFLPPLITDPNADLFNLFFRLLSTEAGVGNSYLLEELKGTCNLISERNCIEQDIADWMASDLYALIKKGRLNTQTARIYRGGFVEREDVSFADVVVPVSIESTPDEKNAALTKMFVGTGKLISRFEEHVIGDEETKTFVVTAEMALPRLRCLQEKNELDTAGTGDTLSLARIAAFMEALERCSTFPYSLDDFPLRSRTSLDKPVLDRQSVAGYGRLDAYCEDSEPETPRRWHSVRNLKNNDEYLVPLEWVRYPGSLEEAGYYPCDEISSSGAAAHFCQDLAIWSACHELVERDAFLIAWLRKASPPLIDHGSLPRRIQEEIRSFSEKGWSLRLMNLTTDLAPVICALLSREKDLYRYAIGAACKEDPEEACLKAIREAHINFSLCQTKPRSAKEVMDKLYTPNDHIELFASGEHDDKLMQFFGHSANQKFLEIKSFPGDIVDRIYKSGMDIFVADLKNPDIHKLAPNIHVVRAIVPGLVPMHFGENWPRTGSPRIKTIPEKIGWTVGASREEEYQRFPHPFN